MAGLDPWGALAAAQATLANSRSQDGTACESEMRDAPETYANSRNSRRGSDPLSQIAALASKDRSETSIIIYQGLSSPEGVGVSLSDTPEAVAGDNTPARVAILREFSASASDTVVFGEIGLARVNPPTIHIPGPHDDRFAPTEWRDGFARLRASLAPCPGFRDREWPLVFAAVHAFLERHAAQADALGWTALELFGVHPVVGAARVDCCGALMVSAGKHVVALERDAIAFAHGRFARRPWRPSSVLAWDFTPHMQVTP